MAKADLLFAGTTRTLREHLCVHIADEYELTPNDGFIHSYPWINPKVIIHLFISLKASSHRFWA